MAAQMKWQFIDTGLRPAAWNMAFDERLARQISDTDDCSVVRVYGWQPHAISVGRNQSMDDFDLGKIRQAGIDIVRRPTGGKAILHANELTYSVVTPCHDLSLKEIYRGIHGGLLEGLRFMGIRAELSSNETNFPELYRQPSAIPCFATSAKCEITYIGKKLIGSAQRRYNGNVLQHGSFPLDAGHLDIVRFLSPSIGASRSTLEEQLHNRTIDAQAILGRHISFCEAADCIRRGLESAWHIQFEPRVTAASSVEHLSQN